MEKSVRLFCSGFQIRRVYYVICMTVCIQHLIATTSATRVHESDLDTYLKHAEARFQHYIKQPDSSDRVLLLENSKTGSEESVETYTVRDKLLFKHPHHLGAVPIKDWNEQRKGWQALNPHSKKTDPAKPRVLIITGSQPAPCPHPGGDHFHLRAVKNKLDYARMHDYELFYNFAFLDPKFTGVWAKLPIIRSLMLSHPEIDWVVWMDADAVFTDMLFEIPFQKYEQYNMVLWHWEDGFKMKKWVAVNDGVFLLRNCQWSLDLIDKWSPFGPAGKVREEAGMFLSSYLADRYHPYPADDQSALMYLMYSDKEVMDKVKLIEKEYKLHGYWVNIVPNYEKYMTKYHPGLGDCRYPFVTHFTGCTPCTGLNNPDYPLEMCVENFNRACNFADNQVLAYMGFQHKDLNSAALVRTWNETTYPLQYVGIHPWQDKLAEVAAAGLPDDCYNF